MRCRSIASLSAVSYFDLFVEIDRKLMSVKSIRLSDRNWAYFLFGDERSEALAVYLTAHSAHTRAKRRRQQSDTVSCRLDTARERESERLTWSSNSDSRAPIDIVQQKDREKTKTIMRTVSWRRCTTYRRATSRSRSRCSICRGGGGGGNREQDLGCAFDQLLWSRANRVASLQVWFRLFVKSNIGVSIHNIL